MPVNFFCLVIVGKYHQHPPQQQRFVKVNCAILTECEVRPKRPPLLVASNISLLMAKLFSDTHNIMNQSALMMAMKHFFSNGKIFGHIVANEKEFGQKRGKCVKLEKCATTPGSTLLEHVITQSDQAPLRTLTKRRMDPKKVVKPPPSSVLKRQTDLIYI